MKRADVKDKKEIERLDNVNNERVATTRKRVSNAIRHIMVAKNSKDPNSDKCFTEIAHAINLLEAANEEMNWACDWFEWNSDICLDIDNACIHLGCALAAMDDCEFNEEYRPYGIEEGLVNLSKVLASLIRWYDEDYDVSEV